MLQAQQGIHKKESKTILKQALVRSYFITLIASYIIQLVNLLESYQRVAKNGN